MPPTLESLGLDRLPHSDRLAVAQALWDSVAAESSTPVLSDARRLELRRRAAEDAAAPDDLIPWEEVKAAARARSRS